MIISDQKPQLSGNLFEQIVTGVAAATSAVAQAVTGGAGSSVPMPPPPPPKPAFPWMTVGLAGGAAIVGLALYMKLKG